MTRPMIVGAMAASVLVGAPTASAAEIKAFRAYPADGAIQYRVVLCARTGADVVFSTRLTALGGATYVLADRTGRQRNVCPTWRWSERRRFPPGRYSTQVSVEVDGQRLRTARVALSLPAMRARGSAPDR